MMVSLFYFVFWAIMRGANFVRPSALHRGYVQIWLFILGWAMLVVVTVAVDRLRIGSGYMFVFLQSALFLVMLIALCELFALPKKAVWGLQVHEDHEARDFARGHRHSDYSSTQPPPPPPPIPPQESATPPGTRESNLSVPGTAPGSAPASRGGQGDDEDAEAPTERTPLVGGNTTGEHARTTFATTYRRSISALVGETRAGYGDGGTEPFEHEQAWSGRLPSWTWFLQFLLLGPFIIILVAQTGLMLVDAVHQTGPDGSSLLLPYLIVSVFAVLLFLPISPFIHRVTHHVPLFVLVVFVATLVYNLAAFPFSANNRYKAYFEQALDLDTGENRVCYTGIEQHIRAIMSDLPSASGKPVSCGESRRLELTRCCYDGAAVAPELVPGGGTDYTNLVTVNASRVAEEGEGGARRGAVRARIEVAANNTRACFLDFARPVASLRVHGGSGWDDRFGRYPEGGVKTLRLWRREWDVPWVVEVEWKGNGDGSPDRSSTAAGGSRSDSALDGTVTCMWSDANKQGTVPALDEALAFAPTWATVSKASVGLVEGKKAFSV